MTHSEKTKEQLIAELEQTLQRLSETEAKLHRLSYENEFRKQTLDTLQTPILVLDRDLKVLHANQAAASMARLPLSSLIGISLFGIFPPAMAENIQTKNIKIFETGEPVLGDEESMDLRGKRQWFRMDRYPFYDDQGELSAVLLIAEDITERKQAEQILRESESRYQELTDALPEAMFETDLTGRITYVNKTGLELMGYTQEDFHQGLTLFGMLVPEDFERLKQNWGRLMNGQEMESHQYTGLRKDGSTFPVLAYSRLKLQNGQPTGLIGFVVDITEQKQIEAQSMARANDLATVASVSTAISTILDPQQMLETVANLTKERFSLYHAHIYLLNENQDTLLLTAGAGQIGQQMVAEKRSIPLSAEKSIVARTARLRSGNIVNDVRSDPEFLPHPLLPNTAAELAVPIIVGDKLLGVLDVQSEQMNRFTDDDINILTTLGSQIAVALQNARQYSQLQQSERLTRAIIDATPDWIFIRDREHRYQLVNNGYARDMNMAPADILGKTDRDLGLPEEALLGDPKTGRIGFWQQDDRVIEIGQSLTFPNESITMNGQTRIFNMIKTPVRDEQGNITGVLAFGRDVTEREGLFEESQRLFEAGQRINTATNIQEMISGMMHGVDIPDVNRAVVFLFEYDEQGEVTTLEVAGNWYSGEGHQPTPVGMRFGIHDLRPQAVKQMLTTEPIFLNETDQLTQQRNILSMAVVPLSAGGKQIGSILLETERFHTFTEDEIRPVLSMSQQLATAIQNRILMQKLSQALSEAQRNQVFLRTLLDTIPNPIFFKDTQGRYIASNKAFQDYIGLTEEELTNKTIFDLQPDRTKSERYDQIDRDLFENPGTQTYEVRVKYADGIFRDVIFNKTTFFNPDGSVAGLVGVMVDITDRKQAEQALLTSQAQLTQALQIAQMGYWEFDFIAQTFTLSQQYMHLLGVKTEGSVTYPVDEFSTRFVHPDDVALVFAAIQQAIASTDPDYAGELEVRLQHTNGHYINTVARFTIQRDETGHALKAIGSSQDITERKTAEEALRQSEIRFRSLVANIAGAVYRCAYDADYTMLYLSDAIQTLSGYPASDFLNNQVRSYASIIHPDDVQLVDQSIARAIEQNESYSMEYRIITANGAIRWVFESGRAIQNDKGEIVYLDGSIFDITERKEAQEQIARLGLMVEQSTQGMSISDMQGNILFVNQAWAAMHGYTVDEMVGRNLSEFTTPDMLTGTIAELQQIVIEKGSGQAEIMDVRRDGSRFPAIQFVSLLRDEKGNPLGLAVVAQDITERKAAEEAIRQSEIRFRTLLQAVPDMIFRLDDQDVFIDFKPGRTQTYLPPELFLGKHYTEVLPPFVTGIMGQAMHTCRETGQPQTIEYELPYPDGRPGYYEMNVVASEQGQVISVVRDITQSKLDAQAIAARAAELATVAEVATSTATILDPQELLLQVVNLTKERFNLYHAHIYLLDESGQNLVLAVGAGEAGRQMVAQGWQIPINRERSLVARTAREQKGALVNDVRAEPDFLPNPLLPNTAAELAVPLITSGRVLGVLDVQSEQVGRFGQEDINVLTILGAQIAVALDNARRYTQLRQSEQLTRTIIDATPDWIFIKDLQHRYRLANRGYANDLHLSPEDFIGKDDLELGFPEELVRGNPEKGIRGFWADDRLVFETGEPQLYPNDPVVIDNEPRIFNTLKTPLRDEHGNIWGVLAFSRDVTERERLLQESSRLYETGRRLVTAASYQDLIEAVMYGVDIPAVNRAVLMLLQYENNTPSMLQVVANWHNGKGHKPTRIGTQIQRSEMGETFESLLCAEPVFINETNPNTRKQGIASMAILPLWSAEKQIGVLLFETEEVHTFTEAQIRPAVSVSQQLAVSLQNRILVTELSQALAEAQRNQVFLRTLLDNIPNPVFFKDTQGRYIGFNKAFQDYIGLTEEQLLGKSVFDLQTDQKLAEKYHQMDVALFENPGTQVYESRVKYADGSFHDVIFNKATYFNPDGSLAGLVGVIVDITDRKQAEQALLTSQAQLTQALEIAEMGYWEFDFVAQTFTLSQQYMHLLGVKTEGSVTYPVDDFSSRFVHPDDVALVFAAIQQAVASTDPDYAGELEVRLQHTNGHYINTIARFTIQRDETGHALKATGSSQDITERKAAEEAIRQSEARFRTLLQAVPDMIFRLNDQDVFIDFKPGRTQTYLPPELFLGKHYTEVLPPFVTGIMGQAMHTCRETGQPQTIEYELPYPDGRPGYYEMNIVASEQGQVISVVRDITQSKLDAQAIAARAVELATVAEVSTAVSTILDPNQMLQTVVNLTKERFNLYHAHIYLFDPADETLRLSVGAGEIGQQMVAEKRFIPLAAEKSLVARTARERVGLIVNDVHADPDFLPHPLLPNTAAEMTAPILVGDKLLGVLDVQSSESNRFTQENADILTTLAAQIGVALQNGRLFITSQSLYRTSQRISAANSADEMLKAIVEAFDIPTLQQTGAAFILQLQRDPTTNEPESAKVLSNWYGTQAIPTIPVGTVFPKAMFSSLKLMLSPSPVFFNDALHDERIDPNSKVLLQQNNSASAAILPLWIGNEQLGSIVIQTAELHAFTEEQIQSYPVLASQLAIALQTRLLLDKLQSSQQQLTQALQIARLAYWQFDVAQSVFTFNDDYYANILHTTAEQMGGYNIPAAQFATLVHPDDRADVPIQIRKAIETTDPDYISIFESRLICPDGVERVIQARIRILKDANGVTTTLYGINQDVTERVIAEQQIARQATQLATVANVSNIIASILDPDQMLQTVVELTKSRFGLYHVHIYLLENDGETLRLKAGAGEIGQQLLAEKHALHIASEVSLVARCARTRQIVVVNDVSKSPDYLAHPLLPNTQSELVIPLLIGNQLLGILDVQAEQINAFSESDANILATLASQVAVSLQNARSFARIQSQAEREALLNTISQQIQSTTTIEAALQVAIREIGRAVGAKRTSILLDLPQKPTSSDSESGNA